MGLHIELSEKLRARFACAAAVDKVIIVKFEFERVYTFPEVVKVLGFVRVG